MINFITQFYTRMITCWIIPEDENKTRWKHLQFNKWGRTSLFASVSILGVGRKTRAVIDWVDQHILPQRCLQHICCWQFSMQSWFHLWDFCSQQGRMEFNTWSRHHIFSDVSLSVSWCHYSLLFKVHHSLFMFYISVYFSKWFLVMFHKRLLS